MSSEEHQPTLLCVDDEPNNLRLLDLQLREHYNILTATNAEEALSIMADNAVGVVMSDERMPGMGGIELLSNLSQDYPAVGRIILSAYGEADRILRALNTGHAHEYILKPWKLDELRQTLGQAFHAYNRRKQLEASLERVEHIEEDLARAFDLGKIVGRDNGLKQVCDLAIRASKSDATCLIRGETGTGKELIARLIHESSPRKNGPFIQVNCASLSDTLLESELFGHEKGAFTGANRRRMGRFELADGGTIFLDEIGDITEKMQADLLRVLQEKYIERLGGEKPVAVDVRVIAATHQDLEEMVKAGSFREDLYYRLNVIPLFIPPLRSRREDISELLAFFIYKHNQERSKPIRVEDGVAEQLAHYDWPGNVREFENLVHRAVVLSDGETLSIDDFTMRFFPKESSEAPAKAEPAPAEAEPESRGRDAAKELSQSEQAEAINQAIQASGGNLSRAARMLDLPRSTLVNRAKKFGLI